MDIKKLTMMLAFILLALAISVSAATVHITYKKDGKTYISTQTSDQLNLTLPKTTLDLDIQNVDKAFKASVLNLDVSGLTELNLSARDIDNNTIIDATVPIGGATRYKPKLAYAFSVDTPLNKTFLVSFNYSSTNLDESKKLVVFQFPFNFTTDTTDYSTYNTFTESGGLSVDRSKNIVSFSITSFSNFVLAVDTESPAPAPSPSSGGGGGGGGATAAPAELTVVPTVEGTVVSAEKDTKINVLVGDKVYSLKITNILIPTMSIRDEQKDETVILLIGLSTDFLVDGDKFIVTLDSITDGVATMIFRLPQPAPSFIPSTPTQQPEEVVEVPEEIPPQPEQPAPSEPAVVPVEAPSIINASTILLALALVIVLVGGLALYRRHLSMDKPPAAIRTSVPLSSPLHARPTLPPKSEVVKDLKRIEDEIGLIKEAIHSKQSIEIVEKKLKTEHYVPKAQLKEMEKFIYHALSEGHDREYVELKLSSKGWPQEAIDDAFEHIDFTDKHVESHSLHTHKNVSKAVPAVKKLLEKGFDEEHIRQALARKGWKQAEIDEIFVEI